MILHILEASAQADCARASERGSGGGQVCLNGLLGESIMAFADVSCMLVQFYDIAMPIHIHAHACKFPDMLCIERFYSVIGSPLVASEGGRVVVQTAAGRGPGVAQAWVRRGSGVGQAWVRCVSKVF